MAEEIGASTRRLPVYLLLDTSGSMHGDAIEAVKIGLKQLRADLQSDPQALESVWMSVITFDNTARQVVPLTEMAQFQEPVLEAKGTTALGDALKLLMECLDREVRKTTTTQKGDWRPMIFIMTDGEPNKDGWERYADELKKRKPGNVIACAAGTNAKEDPLKLITDTVIRIQDATPGSLGAFMKWVTASVSTMSTNVAVNPEAPVNLPPLPQENGIQIVP
ncbi:MAG: VWA domain-containing protein [Planctomycetes bacterium]|nr:VWA domain-containing protein [Planctomycetota bacterium]